MVKGSNGWHNESMRHSEARKFGKASGGKVSAPKGVKSISGTRKTKSKVKTNVVSISKTKINVGQAVEYHNKEAKRLLKENDYAGYRYHTKEAIKINRKTTLAKMQGKKEISISDAENNALNKREEARALARQKYMQKSGEIKVDKKLTPSDYAGFTGTEHYYKDYLGITLTDGVKDLQTRAEANWLTSDIAVNVKSNKKLKNQEFVSINLNVTDNNTATATYGDGNGNTLYTQKYKYTDFPKGKWKFFYDNNVLMLPSEY